jgi:hypothetical protein
MNERKLIQAYKATFYTAIVVFIFLLINLIYQLC